MGEQGRDVTRKSAGRGDFGSHALVGVAAERICGVLGSGQGKSVSEFLALSLVFDRPGAFVSHLYPGRR